MVENKLFNVKSVRIMSVPEMVAVTGLMAMLGYVVPQFTNKEFKKVKNGVSSVIGYNTKVVDSYKVDAITSAED